ncbi:MAG: hypothetical protein KC656_19585 [Myxococcales bacterium]|nr:hypothetical protein [Myxococcales bacterium]MCB9672203.1 hypothetical protein [Alphaproteobacteria bacterium]MCB9694085.1 hypothetical protein [Alphaproteobacteria bacterium]
MTYDIADEPTVLFTSFGFLPEEAVVFDEPVPARASVDLTTTAALLAAVVALAMPVMAGTFSLFFAFGSALAMAL